MVSPKAVQLTPKGDRWRRSGHPWVYRDDCEKASVSLAGQAVQVVGPGGEALGQALYNPVSKIAIRWLTSDPDEKLDGQFWAGRLEQAIQLRTEWIGEDTAYRLVHSEADGLPGLIVDRYGPVLVIQSLSLGIESVLPMLISFLQEKLKPEAVVARNDSHIRKLEGLTAEKKVLSGTLPEELEVQEGQKRLRVHPLEGHKTGLYLDQRLNHVWARSHAKGRALDAFAYQGGFTLQVADQCDEVLAIEDSAAAVGRMEQNLKLNGISNVKTEKGNVFNRLRALEKEKTTFDLVILDPPAFAKNRKEVPNAWRGYREINLRALRLLNSSGRLITCSCSYLIQDEMFISILREAARDSGRKVRLLEIRTQAPDHPVLLTHPESKYLKCAVLAVD